MAQSSCRKINSLFYGFIMPVVKAKQLEAAETEESGWARIKAAFQPTEYEEISPEVATVISVTTNGAFVGAFVGCIVHSRNQYMDFMENCHASQYQSHLDAKADLTNRMVRGSYNGAMTWGTRFLAISFVWSCLAAFIPAYRNERGWFEHVTSGLVAGSLGGYLLSNPAALGIEAKKQTGKLPYRVKSLLIGAASGLTIGAAIALWTTFNSGLRSSYDTRYWDNYWKKQREKRKLETESKD